MDEDRSLNSPDFSERDREFFTISNGTLTAFRPDGSGRSRRIRIPSGVTRIGPRAFAGSDIEEVTFAGEIEEIGEGAFMSCEKLDSVIVPVGAWIGTEAFRGCSSLSSVELSNGVRFIGIYAFDGFKSLQRDPYPGHRAIYRGRRLSRLLESRIRKPPDRLDVRRELYIQPLRVVDGDNSSGRRDVRRRKGVLQLCRAQIREFSSSLKIIGSDAFCECEKLGGVCLPDRLEDIGERAFYRCGTISSITFPRSLKYIGYAVFGGVFLWMPSASNSKIDAVGQCTKEEEEERGRSTSIRSFSTIRKKSGRFFSITIGIGPFTSHVLLRKAINSDGRPKRAARPSKDEPISFSASFRWRRPPQKPVP